MLKSVIESFKPTFWEIMKCFQIYHFSCNLVYFPNRICVEVDSWTKEFAAYCYLIYLPMNVKRIKLSQTWELMLLIKGCNWLLIYLECYSFYPFTEATVNSESVRECLLYEKGAICGNFVLWYWFCFATFVCVCFLDTSRFSVAWQLLYHCAKAPPQIFSILVIVEKYCFVILSKLSGISTPTLISFRFFNLPRWL